MMRWVLLLHRWLGILFGWMLVAWCLSGLVMMYMAYPSMSTDQQARSLATLDFGDCCLKTASGAVEGTTLISALRIEMLSGRPVARLSGTWPDLIDLREGQPLEPLDLAAAGRAAGDYQRRMAPGATLRFIDYVDIDQWTIGANAYAPLALFELGDPERTRIYLSDTGEIVQRTTATQRFWNWLGAVTHWIYPTLLRQNTAAWLQVIIWSSLIGVFMTVLGLYVGIHQLKRRRSGRWSPYRGMGWWHHMAGLVFGLLTLTWLASGFLSVNPWGLLDSPGPALARQRLQDIALTWSDAEVTIRALPTVGLPPDTVRIETAPFDGQLAYLIVTRSGERRRVDAQLMPFPLREEELRAAAAGLHSEGLASAELLNEPDHYYFEHHDPRPFPVYRAVLADPEHTRYYFDPISGQVLLRVDRNRRWYRWLFEGLHRFDFFAGMRGRPQWDALMWLLMIGVTAVCFTGTYLGIRYLRR